MTIKRLRFLAVLLALLFHASASFGAEPVRLELDPTAASLPEGDIRVAIEKELGRPVTGKDPTMASDVHVAVAEQKLVIRVKQGNTVVERSVPLPANLADVPLTVSLIVGNLARDQSVGIAPETAAPPAEPPPRVEATPPPAPPAEKPVLAPVSALDDDEVDAPPPPPPLYRTNWLGLHFAQDMAIVGGNNVCDSNLGQKSSNYACFYEGTTDQPFVHTPFPYRDGIQQGMVFATQRLLVSIDHAFSPSFSLGGRAGYAFGGGPPAGQQVAKVNGAVPDRALGSGGTPFFPYHLEVRAAYWWLPLTNKILRAFVQGTVGAAQVDAKISIPEYDCTKAGMPDKNPEQTAGQSMTFTDAGGKTYTPFEQCKFGKGYYNYRYYKPVMVDGWKKMGQVFFSLGVGSMVAVTDQLGVVLNLNVLYMLPASGIVLQPSLGVEYGL